MRYQGLFFYFTGQGSGQAESSRDWIPGDVALARPFGQAQLRVSANVATGGVFIQGHHPRVEVPGFSIALGWNANVLGGQTVWRHSAHVSLDFSQQSTGTLTITGGDGHAVTYTYDALTQHYVARGLVGGDATIQRQADGTFTRTQFGSGVTHTFNASGELTQQRDAAGNTLTYAYAAGRLSRITSSSGQCVTLGAMAVGVNTVVTTQLSEPGQAAVTVMTDTFTASDQLQQTAILVNAGADPYVVSYGYSQNQLSRITQSDGTHVTFAYDAQQRIDSLTDGRGRSETLTYAAQSTAVSNALGDVTTYGFDAQHRLTQLTKPNGDQPDGFAYTYSNVGQLQTRQRVTAVGSPQARYDYDEQGGLVRTTDALGHRVDRWRDGNGDVVTETRYLLNNAALTTFWVRDPRTREVLFEVSPGGVVMGYTYDGTGFKTASRRYMANRFDVSGYGPHEAIPLDVMTAWVDTQPKNAVQLSTFAPNLRGQVATQITYTQVTPDGEGVMNAQTGVEHATWSAGGERTHHRRRMVAGETPASDEYADTVRALDGLQRVVYEQNPLGGATTHTYEEANQQCVTLYPNQREDTTHWEASGLTDCFSQRGHIGEASPAEIATLTTRYEHDAAGRLQTTHHADGTVTHTVCDGQNRPFLAIDANGYVTQTVYDDENRVLQVIDYAEPLEASRRESLIAEIADARHRRSQLSRLRHVLGGMAHRANTDLYNAAGDCCYHLNGEREVELFVRDRANRLMHTVSFLKKVPDDQPLVLDAAGNLAGFTLADMVAEDPWQIDTRDADGQLIFQQIADSATTGYVTQWCRDLAGNATHTVEFATPVALAPETPPVPSEDKADVHTFDFFDGRNQRVGQVDGEQYVTVRAYLASGQVHTRTRFAQKTAGDPSKARDMAALLPPPNEEDQTHVYQYNLNEQRTSHTTTAGYRETSRYDVMGQKTDYTEHDLNDDDDRHDRHTHTTWNAFGSVVGEANPRVMARYPNDWQAYGTRHVYDATTGLRVQTVEPALRIGAGVRTTTYYYNANRQCVLTVSPEGRLHEQTYHGFGDEVVISRRYQNRWPADQALPSTGGLMTAALRAALDALQDDTQDAVIEDRYDRTGRRVEHRDPKGFVHTWLWNALSVCDREVEPVDAQTQKITVHQFDRRGLAITTTVSSVVMTAVSAENWFDARVSRRLSPSPHSSHSSHSSPSSSVVMVGSDVESVFEDGAVWVSRSPSPASSRAVVTYTTTRVFNFQRKAVWVVDARGSQHRYAFDTLARETAYVDPNMATRPPAEQRAWQTGYDAFSRVTMKKTPLGESTTITYAQGARTITTRTPLGKRVIDTHNAFGEVTDHADGMGQLTHKRYDHGGDCVSVVDALQRETTTAFDVEGKKIEHTTATTLVTQFVHTDDGLLQDTVIDPQGPFERVLQLQQDGRGYVVKKINASGTVTVLQRDPAGNLQTSVFDPQTGKNPRGLNIMTTLMHDAKGREVFRQVGDLTVAQQRVIRTERDALGRVVAEIVDPAGLCIYTRRDTYLADTPHRLTSTDANGGVTRYVYDAAGNERFVIAPHGEAREAPHGAVTEKIYDADHRCIQERTYDQALTADQMARLSDASTPADVAAMVAACPSDAVRYQFYDADGDVVYRVDGLRRVRQFVYDGNHRPVVHIQYALPLNPSCSLAALSVAEMAALIVADAEHDRVYYRWLDAMGQCRYEWSPLSDPENGAVRWAGVGYTYDAGGEKIARRQYAMPLLVLPVLPGDIETRVIPTASADRCTYWVRDALGHPRFVLTPSDEANRYYVTEHTYDREDRLNDTFSYETAIALPAVLTVEAVSAGIIKAVDQDSVSRVILDTAGRKQRVTDAQGRSNGYTYTACHEVRTHTDAAGAVWKEEYDAAGRNTDSITPVHPVTVVVEDAQGYPVIDPATGRLQTVTTERSVVKRRTYDGVGNVQCITEDAGQPGARSIEFHYTLSHQLAGTRQWAWVADDAAGPVAVVDFEHLANNYRQARPEQWVLVTTRKRYNTSGTLMAEQNAAGLWSFHVVDREQRGVYDVDEAGVLTKRVFDTFDQCTEKTVFATPLTGVVSGEPPVLHDANRIRSFIHVSPDDRTTTYAFDIAGNRTALTLPSRFMYLAKAVGEGDYGEAASQVVYVFNRFGEEIERRYLQNPFAALPVWSVTYHRRSHRGLVRATVDSQRYLTVFSFNREQRQRDRCEYANPLPASVDVTRASVAVLCAAVRPSEADYEYLDGYDNCHQHITRLEPLEQSQTGGLNEEKIATLTPQRSRLQKSFFYTARGQVCEEMDSILLYGDVQKAPIENIVVGSCYFFYDSSKQLVAKTQMPRETGYGSTVTCVPVDLMEHNAFGQVVVLRQCEEAGVFTPTQPPAPAASKTDKVEIAVHDVRGLLTWIQFANDSVRQQVFTRLRKLARHWQFDWNNRLVGISHSTAEDILAEQKNSNIVPSHRLVIQVRQVSTDYGPDQQPIRITRRDYNGRQFVQEIDYNAFSEVIAKGRGKADATVSDGNTPPRDVMIYRDRSGIAWLSNRNKQWMVRLDTPTGHESLRLQSAQLDLSGITAVDLPRLLSSDFTQVQKTEIVRNLNGHEVLRKKPLYRDQPVAPLQAALSIGRSYPSFGVTSISWPTPKHATYYPQLTIWRKGDESHKTVLPLQQVDGRWGADTSTLVSDTYHYHLAYYQSANERSFGKPAKEAFGTLGLRTNNTQGSQDVVFLQADEDAFIVTGNTLGLTGVMPLKDHQPILKGDGTPLLLGVSSTDVVNEYSFTCVGVGLGNGLYTFKPIFGATPVGAPVPLGKLDGDVVLQGGQTIFSYDTHTSITWNITPWGGPSFDANPMIYARFKFSIGTPTTGDPTYFDYEELSATATAQAGAPGVISFAPPPTWVYGAELIGAELYVAEKISGEF